MLARLDQWLHRRIDAATPWTPAWRAYRRLHWAVHELAYATSMQKGLK